MEHIVAFFDTKPYDKEWFNKLPHPGIRFKYFENKLNSETAKLALGCDGVVAFVNDAIDCNTIKKLCDMNVEVIAMRCAGYNNIDFKAAYEKITVMRVPGYSPNAVAEYTMALLLTLNRKTHKAYNRTRDYNFSLVHLTGFDLKGKTIGVIGTGKIGREFIDICRGFKMNILAYDPYPVQNSGIAYADLETIFKESHIISLHCPLTKESYHLINKESIKQMKDGVIILNTSRGAIIESQALLQGLKDKKIGGAALDVYEEETAFFYEDYSEDIINDDVLSLLVSMPNVIVTSHQAFLTNEALRNIAQATIDNLQAYFNDRPLTNEICYRCGSDDVTGICPRHKRGTKLA